MTRRRLTAEDAARMAHEDAVRDAIDAAWDATTNAARAKAARRVLKLDPDAIDGYVILAQAIDGEAESVALLFEAVRRGRRQWADAIRRPASHLFWLDMETRPFMRAAHLLALSLWDIGEQDAAVGEAEALLRLNRNDNQGIRDLLLVWYPVTGNWEGMAKLVKRYRDDGGVGHLYGKYLLGLHLGIDDDVTLGEAIEANRHVPAFLYDPERTVGTDIDDPLAAMGFVSAGSKGEAAAYANAARAGWRSVPGSIETLTRRASALISTSG